MLVPRTWICWQSPTKTTTESAWRWSRVEHMGAMRNKGDRNPS